MSFETLGLREELVLGVKELGFEKPTPIQSEAIPLLLEEQSDFVGLAQTGTGKTAAFGLPLLNSIDSTISDTQGVIVCPTRELCLQIEKDLNNFSKKMSWIRVVSVYGGANIALQIRELRKGAHIIVATPGRFVDLINRGKAQLSQVRVAVLDEADEMLNMGFKSELDAILSATPAHRSTWLFSATMPSEVKRISRDYMSNPKELSVGAVNETSNNISHEYYPVKERDRYEALKRVIDFQPNIYGVVFCRTRMETQEIADKLMRDGYSADSLHGDLSQAQRDSVMKSFRKKRIQMLVATDVAARGIDVSDLTHVIHYKLPDDPEVYTHRSGRTGRAGKKGTSVAFITSKELRRLQDIQRMVKAKFVEKEIPSIEDICQSKLYSLVDNLKDVTVHDEEIDQYIEKVSEKLDELSREELIKKIVSKEFNQFLDYYRDARDISCTFKQLSKRSREDRGARTSSTSTSKSGMSRFFINAGHLDGLNKGALVRIICESSSMRGHMIGAIDIKSAYSFFEVENSSEDQIINSSSSFEFEGKGLRVEKAEGGGERRRGGSDRRGGERRGGSSDRRGGERRGGSDRKGGERRSGRRGFSGGDDNIHDNGGGSRRFGNKRRSFKRSN
ncbi:DEAD/DEAH box helicase [Halosquirtibacter laminarini]|uniref:DEAD/DEAH box helicase n=1 Tax=Halosquirtibacter laminarini TaxID=3374600 RepID=A0AC61NIA5_9BACT|nr:DEAD/DEAH box helicase [Prolixibacteraceae bacterium]